MSQKKSFPQPLTILMVAIVLSAISTWLLPAGGYSKLSVVDKSFSISDSKGDTLLPLNQETLDRLGLRISVTKFTNGEVLKPVSVPNTYQQEKSNPQGFINVIQAPVKGIYDSIDVIMFILVMGGFICIFNETRAIEKGVASLSYAMKGKEPYLIVVLTFLFAFCRASYGMEEEALMFYPILVPVFLAAGYDLLVPFAVIFGGNSVGGIAAFSNPFSTIIASNAAGINWKDGIYERVIIFFLLTALFTWYVLRYAAKVKKDPSASLVIKIDGLVKVPYDLGLSEQPVPEKLELKTKMLLLIFLATFLGMIGGTIFLQWWTLEMSSLLLAASILTGLLANMSEAKIVSSFVRGAESLLSVAFIIGAARGITIILNDGHVGDSILYYTGNVVAQVPQSVFILMLFVFFFFFSLFVTSTSGMAVLTMPIMGTLAIMVNIPGNQIVNSYLYGMNIMFFVSPTGLLLPSLALVNVSVKVWIRFITPILVFLFLLCALFLVAGIYL
ncbi:YfcC family protein [Dyadobacter psychrotolerans]|uniref:YfcC family protein n=1 Tax=Dyadobacter psychrotolerans TaxID=2541721 RepID=A0A4R5DWM0_9BACT|nr:YfcC family protein [Dyadobacter psychrotolerans]TDE18287.1 YfcC family protein [Dyadobacter psychrotolerans]